MSTFVINTQNASIVGFVQNMEVASDKAGEHLCVNTAKDLEGLSLQQLTDLFNAYSGVAPVGKFKVAKDKAAEKVFKLLSGLDTATLVQLDKEAEKVVEQQAEVIAQEEAKQAEVQDGAAAPNGPKVRKIRDSKLQRMKAAFLMKDDNGNFKQWTVKELMEKCGTSERITHVYISILRSPSDRFVMNIEKVPVEAGQVPQFKFAPKESQAQEAAQQDQQSA